MWRDVEPKSIAWTFGLGLMCRHIGGDGIARVCRERSEWDI
jgi:hypothetical protein